MLYDLAGSQLLARLISDLAEALHRFRVALLSDPDMAARSLDDHRAMLEALRAGRTSEAVEACRAHVLSGGGWILDHLEAEEEEA
jgi:DNA-binding GntR family transcriptional regulator